MGAKQPKTTTATTKYGTYAQVRQAIAFLCAAFDLYRLISFGGCRFPLNDRYEHSLRARQHAISIRSTFNLVSIRLRCAVTELGEESQDQGGPGAGAACCGSAGTSWISTHEPRCPWFLHTDGILTAAAFSLMGYPVTNISFERSHNRLLFFLNYDRVRICAAGLCPAAHKVAGTL
jgi:hypothetical protein